MGMSTNNESEYRKPRILDDDQDLTDQVTDVDYYTQAHLLQ